MLLLLMLRGLTVLLLAVLLLPLRRLLLAVAACLAREGQTCACSGVLVHGLVQPTSRACQ